MPGLIVQLLYHHGATLENLLSVDWYGDGAIAAQYCDTCVCIRRSGLGSEESMKSLVKLVVDGTRLNNNEMHEGAKP